MCNELPGKISQRSRSYPTPVLWAGDPAFYVCHGEDEHVHPRYGGADRSSGYHEGPPVPEDRRVAPVPEEWEVGQLNDYCSLIIDCPHSTPHFIETGILVIRTSNVRDGKLVFNPPSYISEEEYKERIDRGEPQENDLLFTREAPIGETCLVPTNTRLCLGQR
jgi:hypothetical protein